MREIVFRGKDANGEWLYNYAGQYPGGALGQTLVFPADAVGQYTGIKDKHGAMIFEGDIVTAYLPGTQAQMEFDWGLREVVFDNGAFGLQMHREVIPFRSFAPRVEFMVVGNIYDNPEMEVTDHA